MRSRKKSRGRNPRRLRAFQGLVGHRPCRFVVPNPASSWCSLVPATNHPRGQQVRTACICRCGPPRFATGADDSLAKRVANRFQTLL
jgi:hypothetical protein